jgi:tetratricopeptide (TPR) repeat protein
LNIFGLEMSLNPELIGQINIEREHLFRTFPCVIFLWLNEENTLRLRREAADFSSWITYDFRFYTTADEREQVKFSGIDLKKALKSITENKPLSIAEIEKIKQEILQLERELKNLERKKNTSRVQKDKLQVLLNLISNYSELEDNEKILFYVSKGLKISPNDYRFLLGKGIVYKQIGDNVTALKYYQKSLKIFPNSITHITMGDFYFNLGDYKNAIKYYLEVIDVIPNNDNLLGRLSLSYLYLKEYEKVIKIIQKYIHINNSFDIWSLLSMAYQQIGNLTKANEAYLKILETHYDKSIIDVLGWNYIVLGDLNEAEKYLLITVETDKVPTNFQNLGHIYFCRHNFPQALEYYKKSLALFENKELFFENMKNDYQYLVQYNVKQEDYENIQNELRAAM